MSTSPKKSPKRQAPGVPTSPVSSAQPNTAAVSPTSASSPTNPADSTIDKNKNPVENKNVEESELDIETGGLSVFKKVDNLITRVVSKIEEEIKSKINELKKDDPPLTKNDKLEIVGYRSNVVAGFIYFAKIKIRGDSFVQARILETPKGEISLQTITETKTMADEEEYFKLPKSTRAPSPVPASVTIPKASVPLSDKKNESDKVDQEEEYQTGGLSIFKALDHVIKRVVSSVEEEIKTKINELCKAEPPLDKSKELEIVGYRSNVVAGYIYFAKIKIPGNSFIQARILETPKGEISLQSVTETKTDADEKEYFKLP
jgi:hypothetical protein